MSSIRSPVKTIVIASVSPVSGSGPSYTYSREHTFINIVMSNFNLGRDITFNEFTDPTSSPNFTYGTGDTLNTILLSTVAFRPQGGIAFFCPTTLSNITGSINFGFRDLSSNDISLNIYKTSISNAYTAFNTGATLLFSSRFIYNTQPNVSNITVPVNVTNAGLTSNDIVFVAFKPMAGATGPNGRFTMRYTLSFS